MGSTPLSPLHRDMEGVLARIIQGFMSAMKQHGLSTPQVHALMHILHAGECQVSDIGSFADVSNAAASQLVERLVQQALVSRRESPRDRRIKLVTLSRKGQDLFHKSVTSNPALNEILAILTPEQRQAVHSAFMLLARAGRQLQESRETGESQDAHAQ